MNNKNYVIFKNPYLRYRKEKFGGIVKLQLKTFVINQKQYEIINKIKKVLVYNSLRIVEKKIVDKLIENNILLKINMDKAEKLGYKK